MKFKMIAGCLAAGLGLVSVGAHADTLIPLNFVTKQGSLDNPNFPKGYFYKQARVENGMYAAAGDPNFPLTGKKAWALIWTPPPQGWPYSASKLGAGNIPKKTDLDGNPVSVESNRVLAVEIRKTDKATEKKYLYFRRVSLKASQISEKTETDGGRLLVGTLPEVPSSQKLRIFVSASGFVDVYSYNQDIAYRHNNLLLWVF